MISSFAGYFFRPLWDKPNPRFTLIDHFFTPNLNLTNAEWCGLHGWFEYGGRPSLSTPNLRGLDGGKSVPNAQSGKVANESHDAPRLRSGVVRQSSKLRKRQVVDAVIFANELDLLEIRLRELEPVVDKFVILESNGTFTGHPKETVFANNRNRYNFIPADRIIHEVHPLYPLLPHEGPFENESKSFWIRVKVFL